MRAHQAIKLLKMDSWLKFLKITGKERLVTASCKGIPMEKDHTDTPMFPLETLWLKRKLEFVKKYLQTFNLKF